MNSLTTNYRKSTKNFDASSTCEGRENTTYGSKIIQTLAVVRVKKVIPIAVL